MNYKRWLLSGVIVFVGGMAAGALGMIWWLWSVTHDPAHQTRIHDDGSFDIPNVMYAVSFMFLGCLIGGVLIAIGSFKAYRSSQNKDLS